MSLIKSRFSDVKSHLSTRAGTKVHLSEPEKQSNAAGPSSSEVKADVMDALAKDIQGPNQESSPEAAVTVEDATGNSTPITDKPAKSGTAA